MQASQPSYQAPTPRRCTRAEKGTPHERGDTRQRENLAHGSVALGLQQVLIQIALLLAYFHAPELAEQDRRARAKVRADRERHLAHQLREDLWAEAPM